jgi:N-acetylneuraminic acid mutarotase
MTFRAALLALAFAAGGGGGDSGPDAPPSAWSNRAPVTGGLQEMGAVAIDGTIYTIGGFDAETQVLPDVRVYDIASDTWSMGPPLPMAIHHANVVLVDGTIYVVGAMQGRSFTAVRNVWSWTPATETAWRERASMPAGSQRGSAVAGVIDGTIYVAGGLTATAHDSLVSYDPATDTWDTALPPMPGRRDHACGAVIDGTLYVAGGREVAIDSVYASLFAYRPGQGWSERALMPTGRGGTGCAVIDGRLIVVGGEGNPDIATGVFYQVEAYDPIADAWQPLEPMASPRHGMPAVAWEGNLYVPGGARTDGFGAVEDHQVLRVRR